MVTPQPSPRQVKLEERMTELASQSHDPEQMVSDVYGDMEEWLLRLGNWDMLMMPVTGRWYYFDQIHENWEDTGYDAGEAVFYLEDDALEVEPLSPEPPPTAATICASCGAANPDGSRFCNNCGKPLAAGQDQT